MKYSQVDITKNVVCLKQYTIVVLKCLLLKLLDKRGDITSSSALTERPRY